MLYLDPGLVYYEFTDPLLSERPEHFTDLLKDCSANYVIAIKEESRKQTLMVYLSNNDS